MPLPLSALPAIGDMRGMPISARPKTPPSRDGSVTYRDFGLDLRVEAAPSTARRAETRELMALERARLERQLARCGRELVHADKVAVLEKQRARLDGELFEGDRIERQKAEARHRAVFRRSVAPPRQNPVISDLILSTKRGRQ